jgi:hypothetical protein
MSTMVDNVISKLAPFNRPHKPSAATADFLFRVYKLLLEAPPSMNDHAKKRTFENAADGAHSWTVVCISRDALEHVATNGDTKTLRRAHALSRELRFQKIFGPGAKVWAKDELMGYFFENDTCALVSFDENKKHTTDGWSDLYMVPELLPGRKETLMRSFPGSFSVGARKTVEVTWAKALWEKVRPQ